MRDTRFGAASVGDVTRRVAIALGVAAAAVGCDATSPSPTGAETSSVTPTPPASSRSTLPGWSAAEAISTTTSSASGLYLAGNDSGDVFAVWSQYEPPSATHPLGVSQTLANRFAPGVGWEGPRAIGSDSPDAAGVDDEGNAFVLMRSSDGRDVTLRRFDVRSGWQTAMELRNAMGADCAVAKSGAALLVWADGEAVWARDFDRRHGWSEMERIGRRVDGDGTVRQPRALLDPQGGALVTWEQGFLSSRRTPPYGYPRWTGRSPRGGWRPASDLGDLGWPRAFDDGGRALAVWYDAPRRVNRYAWFTGGDGAFEVGDVGTPPDLYPVDVATNGAGTRVLVLGSSDGRRRALMTLRRDTGWGPVEVLPGSGGSMRAGVDAAGLPLLVWAEASAERGLEPWAFVARTGAAGLIATTAAPRTCPNGLTGGVRGPYVTVDTQGNAVAVWADYACDHSILKASRYTPPSR